MEGNKRNPRNSKENVLTLVYIRACRLSSDFTRDKMICIDIFSSWLCVTILKIFKVGYFLFSSHQCASEKYTVLYRYCIVRRVVFCRLSVSGEDRKAGGRRAGSGKEKGRSSLIPLVPLTKTGYRARIDNLVFEKRRSQNVLSNRLNFRNAG